MSDFFTKIAEKNKVKQGKNHARFYAKWASLSCIKEVSNEGEETITDVEDISVDYLEKIKTPLKRLQKEYLESDVDWIGDTDLIKNVSRSDRSLGGVTFDPKTGLPSLKNIEFELWFDLARGKKPNDEEIEDLLRSEWEIESEVAGGKNGVAWVIFIFSIFHDANIEILGS
jgi:hypothetical protein